MNSRATAMMQRPTTPTYARRTVSGRLSPEQLPRQPCMIAKAAFQPASSASTSQDASWLYAGLLSSVSDEDGPSLDGEGAPTIDAARIIPDPSAAPLSSLDTWLVNSVQPHMPGCGSHSLHNTQPWQQVVVQGCYVLHGPAMLKKVGNGLLQAVLQPGAWLDILDIGDDTATSICKEAERYSEPAGLLLSGDCIRITTNPSVDLDSVERKHSGASDNSSNGSSTHRSFYRPADHSMSSGGSMDQGISSRNSHGTSNKAQQLGNGNGHGVAAADNSPEDCAACKTVYLLSGAHMELRGSYSIHSADTARSSSWEVESSAAAPHTPAAHSLHPARQQSCAGGGPLHGTASEICTAAAAAGGLEPEVSSSQAARTVTIPRELPGVSSGLLPHDGYVLVSVHSLPKNAPIITLYHDSVLSHPLNVVNPKRF